MSHVQKDHTMDFPMPPELRKQSLRKRILKFFGLAVICMVALTGCGSDAEDDWVDEDFSNDPAWVSDEAALANYRCSKHGGIREFNNSKNGSTAAICNNGVAVSLDYMEVENAAAEEAFVEKWGTNPEAVEGTTTNAY